MLSLKFGKTFASAVHVFLVLVLVFLSGFSCVHVPGCENGIVDPAATMI